MEFIKAVHTETAQTDANGGLIRVTEQLLPTEVDLRYYIQVTNGSIRGEAAVNK